MAISALLTGAAYYRIDVTTAGRLALRPAVLSHVRARNSDPDTWAYTLQVPYPYGMEIATYPAARVLALRLHAEPARPWEGRSPLALSGSTAGLAALAERQLAGEMSVVTGRILGVPSGTKETPDTEAAEAEIGDVLRRSDGVLALFDYDEADSTNPDVKPDRWKPGACRGGTGPRDRGPALRVAARYLRSVRRAVLAPLPETGQAGTGVIELRRSWLRGAVAPLMADFAAQMAGPLDAPDLAFTLPALESDVADSESRAVMRRAAAVRSLTAAGLQPEAARAAAGL